MRSVLAFGILLAGTSSVLASAGIDCHGEDANARLALSAGVTRGMGGPVFAFRGELEILAKDVREELRKTVFERQHLAQYWWDNRELRLLLYSETAGDGPHGSVELTIQTQASGDEITYSGPYSLTIFDMAGDTTGEGKTLVLDGTVSCSVE